MDSVIGLIDSLQQKAGFILVILKSAEEFLL